MNEGTLPVVELVSATPAMAKGTASVKPAGGAEKATAVKLEALEPRAYGEAGMKGHCRSARRGLPWGQDTAARLGKRARREQHVRS